MDRVSKGFLKAIRHRWEAPIRRSVVETQHGSGQYAGIAFGAHFFRERRNTCNQRRQSWGVMFLGLSSAFDRTVRTQLMP
eukprot:11440339-Alexandrium_andersonii.AAC.1